MSKEKDYRNITLEEAFAWTRANCAFEHNRKNIRSRAVAWILAKAVSSAVDVIEHRNREIEGLKKELDSLQEQINSMRDVGKLDSLEI
jgi:hypothetical protein